MREVDAADRRDRKDHLARLIGSAIYRPQPHMSGDIWERLGPLRRRGCEDAAESVMEFEDGRQV
jgi:hypothetical protein